MEGKKECTKCHKILDVNEFRKDKTKLTGRYSSCNDCYRKKLGYKKMEHSILGYFNGYTVVRQKRELYPRIIGIPGGGMEIHRYIMEKKLGRKLLKTEHVHHIDGNKQNYTEDNLIVLKESEHHILHGKTLPHRGVNVNCHTCGKHGYIFPSAVKTCYHGDEERLKAVYLCQPCYYKSKRWIKACHR